MVRVRTVLVNASNGVSELSGMLEWLQSIIGVQRFTAILRVRTILVSAWSTVAALIKTSNLLRNFTNLHRIVGIVNR
jgi:hypothetical protein